MKVHTEDLKGKYMKSPSGFINFFHIENVKFERQVLLMADRKRPIEINIYATLNHGINKYVMKYLNVLFKGIF